MDSRNSSTSSKDTKTGSDPPLPTVDLSKPRYDQSTYHGRLRHFLETTNPLNVFASNKRLDEAATLVNLYKCGKCPPGTTEKQLWRAKRLYDSAFNPESGKKKIIIGRMSFQVPGNMFISGMMLTFFKSPYAVTFWQWVNQSFNAVVNYTNKSGSNEDSKRDVAASFAAATIAAVGTGVGLNKVVTKHFSPRSLPARLVPFAAGAAGNMINVPMMRHKELLEGIKLMDENDKDLEHKSKRAAQKAIARTVLTRIAISAPAMVFPAVVMEQLEKRVTLRAPWMKPTLTVSFVGLSLVFAVPVCLAIFPQQSSMPTSSLEPGVREAILSTHPDIKTVYFNKGL